MRSISKEEGDPSRQSRSGSDASGSAADGPAPEEPQHALANITYRNQDGKEAVLAVARAVHEDCAGSAAEEGGGGWQCKMLRVEVPAAALEALARDPNISRIDRVWESAARARARDYGLSHPHQKGKGGRRSCTF